jgi:hypothetical protein
VTIDSMNLDDRIKAQLEINRQLDNWLASTSPELSVALKRVKVCLGANYIGPEAFSNFLGFEDVGVVPPLPPTITPELLEAKCPIFKNGQRIKDTHLLVFIPQTVDKEPFTINALTERTKIKQLKTLFPDEPPSTKIFTFQPWYHEEEFANTSVANSRWMLMPKRELPDSIDKTAEEQDRLLLEYPGYETPRAIELLTMLVINLLQNGERLFKEPNLYLACSDMSSLFSKPINCRFGYLGFRICCDDRHFASAKVGRAIVRRGLQCAMQL